MSMIAPIVTFLMHCERVSGVMCSNPQMRSYSLFADAGRVGHGAEAYLSRSVCLLCQELDEIEQLLAGEALFEADRHGTRRLVAEGVDLGEGDLMQLALVVADRHRG